ncbi:MAG: hypothetical protein WDN49_07555 [Acetobacteraceae bacterium]
MGVRIKNPALIIGAVCGSALGNIAGFGPLSGGAVRCRVYGAVGIGSDQVARLMTWITVGFGAGLVMFAAMDAVFSAKAVAAMLGVPILTVRAVCIAVLCLGAAAVALCRSGRPALRIGRVRIAWPPRRFVLGQFALLAINLLSAGAALWILLPQGKADFLPFMAVFSVATALGALSHVPGGLGVFETAIVFAVGRSIPSSEVMAALIAYRLAYFFLPLLMSGGLLAAFELRSVPAPMSSPTMLRLKRSAGQLAPMVLGVITFTIGVMLLLSGATPALSHRLAILAMTLPLWAVEIVAVPREPARRFAAVRRAWPVGPAGWRLVDGAHHRGAQPGPVARQGACVRRGGRPAVPDPAAGRHAAAVQSPGLVPPRDLHARMVRGHRRGDRDHARDAVLRIPQHGVLPRPLVGVRVRRQGAAGAARHHRRRHPRRRHRHVASFYGLRPGGCGCPRRRIWTAPPRSCAARSAATPCWR